MPDEVSLPPHPASVGRARRFVRDRFAAIGMRDPGAGARVEVGDGSSVMPGQRVVRPMSSSGRGLTMVEHFARSWGAASTAAGKIVWFVVGEQGQEAR